MTNPNGQVNQPLKLRFDSGPTTIDLLTLDSVDAAAGNGSGINFTNSTNNAEGSFLVLGRIRATRPDELTVRLDLMVNPALSSDNARPVLSLLGGTDAAGNILTDRVSLAGALSVTDATSLGGLLNVAGAATLSGTLSASGAATLGGTLRVAGAATLNNSLAVAGPATLNSSLAVAGPATLNSSLNVAGPTALAGTLRVAGAVGIGTNAMQRPLHVEGHEIHSGGPAAGFSFSNRGSQFVDSGNAGERWVLYSHDRVAHLWTGGDQYFFTPQGEFGRRGGSSVLHLGGSRIMDMGDARLRLRSGGHMVTFDGGDNVGIGTPDPIRPLHVRGNAGVLALEGGDHAYIEYYPDGVGAGRKAWIGYGSGGDNNLTIANEFRGNWINLNPNGGRVGVWSPLYVQGNIGVGRYGPEAVPDWSGGGIVCWDILYFGGSHKLSTIRVKEGVAPLSGILGRIEQLNPVRFDQRAEGSVRPPALGFIAEELREVLPECASPDGDFFAWGVNESALHAVAIAGLQELTRKVARLERRARRRARPTSTRRARPTGAPAITILGEGADTTRAGERYVTACFSAEHAELGNVQTIRTLRVPPDTSCELLLHAEGERWLQGLG